MKIGNPQSVSWLMLIGAFENECVKSIEKHTGVQVQVEAVCVSDNGSISLILEEDENTLTNDELEKVCSAYDTENPYAFAVQVMGEMLGLPESKFYAFGTIDDNGNQSVNFVVDYKHYQSLTQAQGGRIFQLHTVWEDGSEKGGTSFLFEVSQEVPIGEEKTALRAAAKEFLSTEEGRKFNEQDCNGSFGWGDIVNVPDEILANHGIKEHKMPLVNLAVTVNHDEILFKADELN